jgi:hypothetical protein
MQPMIKRLLSIILLVAGVQAGWGFALLGPLGTAALTSGHPNGDAWQTVTIGYELAYTESLIDGGPVFLGDVGGPKNIGEFYRRNTPQLYYAYDASFLGFFGSDGATNADNAFAIMNNLTNVDNYSSDLTEFPLKAQHFNFSAQNAFLTDLKSVTLHLLVETMGLAEPERFTWTMAERVVPPGCPLTTEYLILHRNFAISPTGPSQVQYSTYVNNVLYTYRIVENCSGPNPVSYTVDYSTDPLSDEFTAVAANDFDGFGGVNESTGGGLQIGGYYTSLTRDDVAGLRYLLTSNNVVTEDAAAGSQTLSTNLPPLTLVQTLSWGLFLSQLTNDPATLQGIYPNLIITSVTTNFSETNVTILTPAFTNFPGTTFTNFAPPILITNIDIALFYQQLLTNPPAVLQALYPQLQILSSSILYYTNIPIPNIVTYLTNGGFGSPAGTVIQVTATNGFSPNIFPIYTYTFGNIYTNAFALNNTVTNQIITLTNLIGAPAGSQVLKVTNKALKLTNSPSGDFFIIPTNWCGFNIFQKIYQQKVPSFTNTLSVAFTNNLGSAAFTQNLIYYYTNRIWAVQPGVCEPTLIFETNAVSLVLTNYQYTFGNLYTNPPTMQFTNSQVITIITNVGPCPGDTAGQVCTNITTTTNIINTPSGDFFIIPAAWTCGFDIVSVVSTNLVGTTNTILTLPPAGVTNEGEYFSVTTISTFTNHTLLIQPFICVLTPPVPALREGIEKVNFVRTNFDAFIGQLFLPITNRYTMIAVNTNGLPVTEYYERIITQPDIVLSADDQIAANTFNGTVTRNINFDTANVPNGLAGPGVINGPITFAYNKIGDAYENGSLAAFSFTTNQFLTELTQTPVLAWASYDGSTNAPELYPNGNSILNLENQLIIQISPTSLANGTAGVPYSPVTFTTTGGAFIQPYTWSGSNLPPGMGVSAGGTISGTPTQSGTFDITITMTDSQARSVQWFYTLIIE